MQQSNMKPIFEIEQLKARTITETVAVYDDERKLKGFETQQRKVEGGYMVYFPMGHSLFVESAAQLERMGLMHNGKIRSGLVDMATGEQLEDAAPGSLKELVERKTRSRVTDEALQ